MYCPLLSISAEFLSNKVASVVTVWRKDMSLVTTMLIYLMLELVYYPIIYHYLPIIMYHCPIIYLSSFV